MKLSEVRNKDPLVLFEQWFAEAQAKELNDPDAMALATADAEGRPSLRMVLLKAADVRGFVFYTNLGSRKGNQLAENASAALLFHWKSLRRQVRIEGPVLAVANEEADAYFASRARASQIGAWASKQSHPLEGRLALEKRVAEFTAKFGVGKVPRPEFWSGYRVVAHRMEFWQDGAFRLHDRFQFTRADETKPWDVRRLYP